MDTKIDAGTKVEGDTPHPLATRLVYDTRSQPLPVGVRAVVQRARRLLFAASDIEVLLQVSPGSSPDVVKVMGQVWNDGLPVSGADVRLDGPRTMSDWVTDGAGQFRFADLPKGDYALQIGTADHLIQLPRIDVDDAQAN